MKKYCLFFLIFAWVFPAGADIASVSYVSYATETKVDMSANANQTMAGTYTVSGTLIVPTQPIPTAQ